MRFTFTLEDWIFILRAWLDESYPLDLGKSPKNYLAMRPNVIGVMVCVLDAVQVQAFFLQCV